MGDGCCNDDEFTICCTCDNHPKSDLHPWGADTDAEPEDDPITPWRHPDFPGDAEGGRPRKADPQGSGMSPGTGDASVDDGRSRAIEAANVALRQHGLVNAATTAIDAALAEGGVATAEEVLHERWWGNAHFADWQRARDRVTELEAALGDLLADLDPVCGNQWMHASAPPQNCGECPGCRARAALGEANR